jgi:hypothetical protein
MQFGVSHSHHLPSHSLLNKGTHKQPTNLFFCVISFLFGLETVAAKSGQALCHI